jgi:hypothetical protein
MGLSYSKEKNRVMILWFLLIRIGSAFHAISLDFKAWVSSLFDSFTLGLFSFFVLPQLIAFFLILLRKKVGYYVLLLSALPDYILISAFWRTFFNGDVNTRTLYETIFISIYYLAIIILPIYQLKNSENEF